MVISCRRCAVTPATVFGPMHRVVVLLTSATRSCEHHAREHLLHVASRTGTLAARRVVRRSHNEKFSDLGNTCGMYGYGYTSCLKYRECSEVQSKKKVSAGKTYCKVCHEL